MHATSVFHRILDSGIPLRSPFFQSMLSFCKRHFPSKAPSVLHAAVSRDVPVCDMMFCTFLGACQKTSPPLLRQALDLYARCGLRSHEVIFGVANICRLSKSPSSALFLVTDAVHSSVEFSERLLSIFAVCCAESQCPQAADTAEQLFDLLRQNVIAPQHNQQLFANLMTALLAQHRFEQAVNALKLMDSIGTPPSWQIYTHVLFMMAKAGRITQAMSLFLRMTSHNVHIDAPVFSTLVSACGRQRDASSIAVLHEYAHAKGWLSLNDFIVSAFVSAYDHCGQLDAAKTVFEARRAVSDPDLVVFHAMVLAYAHHDKFQNAIAMVDQLEAAGQVPIVATYSCLISALANSDNIADASRLFFCASGVHSSMNKSPTFRALIMASGRCHDHSTLRVLLDHAQQHDLLCDDLTVSSFITAYSQSGYLDAAVGLFHGRCSLPDQSHIDTFDAIIEAYCMHGKLANALEALEQMKSCGLSATGRTLASLLMGCSHVGDRDRALCLLSEFKALPLGSLHRASLVDLHGRTGDLDAAERVAVDFAENGVLPWMAMLVACRRHNDLDRAERVFSSIGALALDSRDLASAYTLLMDLYNSAGRFEDVSRLQEEKASKGLRALPDATILHLADRNVQFERAVADSPRSRSAQHDRLIERLNRRSALGPVRASSEPPFAHHSVIRAIADAFDLVPDGEPIRLFKHGRLCDTCHQAIKRISLMYDRHVYVRDATRHHNFACGHCSCNDYW